MRYLSTRTQTQPMPFCEAVRFGLAPDGGLILPEFFPAIPWRDHIPVVNYPEFASAVLAPYVAQSKVSPHLFDACVAAFPFPVPITQLNDNTFLLELFHGPTLSFKDFGARFLAACLQYCVQEKPITILVATSGDTGSAVASAFHGKEFAEVVILYPKDKVSARQAKQMTTWGDNVLALAVEGNFDDCQKLIKDAFSDAQWRANTHLSTANSINIGRLLAQVVYYAYASVQFYATYATEVGFIVPSGNLGNVTAAFWAKAMGFPIREIAIATNANRFLSDYIETGLSQSRPAVHTLANAMDVGNPSNFERLQALYPRICDFRDAVKVQSVTDEQIRFAIQAAYRQEGALICPHTATAYCMRQHCSNKPWMIVATAHPAKFETLIEPLLKTRIAIPDALQAVLAKLDHAVTIAATPSAFWAAFQAWRAAR